MSFLHNSGPHKSYVAVDGFVVGAISRVARRRFKWVRYAKPPRENTKAEKEPKAAEVHYVPSFSTARWAITLSYRNAMLEPSGDRKEGAST